MEGVRLGDSMWRTSGHCALMLLSLVGAAARPADAPTHGSLTPSQIVHGSKRAKLEKKCETDENCSKLPEFSSVPGTPKCINPEGGYYSECISCTDNRFQKACNYWEAKSFLPAAEEKCHKTCTPLSPPPPSQPPPASPPAPPPPLRPQIPSKSLSPIFICTGCAGLLVLFAALAKCSERWRRLAQPCFVQRQTPTFISVWDRCRPAGSSNDAPEQSGPAERGFPYRVLYFMGCVIGVLGCQLTVGAFQERVELPQAVITVCGWLTTVLFSCIALLLIPRAEVHGTAPLHEFAYSALSAVASMWAWCLSVNHVPFVLLMLADSLKARP